MRRAWARASPRSGATLLAPGLVRAFPGHVVLEAHASAHLAALADALARAGLPTETVPDLEPHVWRKLAVNCALNAVTAVLDVPNGAVLDDPQARALAEAAAREVAAVARARGVALPGDPAVDALSVARRTVANRSSMLQDLDRGAPTEIEFLNGAVVREGRRARRADARQRAARAAGRRPLGRGRPQGPVLIETADHRGRAGLAVGARGRGRPRPDHGLPARGPRLARRARPPRERARRGLACS